MDLKITNFTLPTLLFSLYITDMRNGRKSISIIPFVTPTFQCATESFPLWILNMQVSESVVMYTKNAGESCQINQITQSTTVVKESIKNHWFTPKLTRLCFAPSLTARGRRNFMLWTDWERLSRFRIMTRLIPISNSTSRYSWWIHRLHDISTLCRKYFDDVMAYFANSHNICVSHNILQFAYIFFASIAWRLVSLYVNLTWLMEFI